AGHGKALNRIFFFPGFTAATGGLLREQGLLQRHAAWQQDESRAREQLFSELGLPGRLSEGTALISVFTYESASIPNWFRALSDSSAPVCCLVPQGRAVAAVADSFERRQLLPGDVLVQGALTVVILPFLSQDDYDRLLSVCDFNLVRGEDSFVRAQWAARPLLWHIYPQDDEAHLIKLQAFLDLYGAEDQGAGDSHQALTAMSRFWLAWNRGED